MWESMNINEPRKSNDAKDGPRFKLSRPLFVALPPLADEVGGRFRPRGKFELKSGIEQTPGTT